MKWRLMNVRDRTIWQHDLAGMGRKREIVYTLIKRANKYRLAWRMSFLSKRKKVWRNG